MIQPPRSVSDHEALPGASRCFRRDDFRVVQVGPESPQWPLSLSKKGTSHRRILPGHRARGASAFTLIELLIVIAIIAGLSSWVVSGLRSGGGPAALRSAQSALINLITLARTQALASGQPCRLLVHIDPNSTARPSRYLRYCVLQQSAGGTWQTTADLYLPGGVFVVPGDFPSLPTGLYVEGAGVWLKADGVTPLRSTALRSNQIVSESIGPSPAEKWVALSFSAVGTTSQSGDLIFATGRQRPESTAPAESPIELSNHDEVCGLTISAYGLAVLINDRLSF